MTHLDILRYQKELRLCNIHDISERLLEATDGNVFVCFNVLRDEFELHAVSSFRYTGVSYNTTLPKEMLNGDLVRDYLCNAHKKQGTEVRDRRLYSQALADKHEETKYEQFSRQGLRVVERTLGRTL